MSAVAERMEFYQQREDSDDDDEAVPMPDFDLDDGTDAAIAHLEHVMGLAPGTVLGLVPRSGL